MATDDDDVHFLLQIFEAISCIALMCTRQPMQPRRYVNTSKPTQSSLLFFFSPRLGYWFLGLCRVLISMPIYPAVIPGVNFVLI